LSVNKRKKGGGGDSQLWRKKRIIEGRKRGETDFGKPGPRSVQVLALAKMSRSGKERPTNQRVGPLRPNDSQEKVFELGRGTGLTERLGGGSSESKE